MTDLLPIVPTFRQNHHVLREDNCDNRRNNRCDNNRDSNYTCHRNSDNGWKSQDDFQRHNKDSSCKHCPHTCLVCGGLHTIKNHPPAQTDVRDRKPCFSTYEGHNLKTARSGRLICIGYNGRPCDGSSHSAECLHICSLCGGDHPPSPSIQNVCMCLAELLSLNAGDVHNLLGAQTLGGQKLNYPDFSSFIHRCPLPD
jgi:hypothetical protein